MNKGAFFDLDGTIVDCVTEYEFWKYVAKKETNFLLYPLIEFHFFLESLKYKNNYGEVTKTYKNHKIRNMKDLKGRNSYELLQLYNHFFEIYLKKRIFPEMKKLIHSFKNEKILIYIITSSVDYIAKKYCDYLMIDGYCAVNLEIDENELFTGNIIGDIPYGNSKAEFVRLITKKNNIDLSNSFAYGDKYSDRFMLKIVGNPVVVNPDNDLRRYADEKKIPLLEIQLK